MKKLSPPLPFCGHKGIWNSELSTLAQSLSPGDLVIDLFGGSGVCAQIFKTANPALNVVWNDFDDYALRLLHAQETEELRKLLVSKLGVNAKSKLSHYKRLTEDESNFVFETCTHWQQKYGYLDWQTLSRYFILNSMTANRFMKFTNIQYNKLRKTSIDTDKCAHWLDGVERACEKFEGGSTVYRTAFRSEELATYPADRTRLLIVDPPYLGTACDDYTERENLLLLRQLIAVLKHEPHFVFFGDESIAFWYELALGDRFKFYSAKTASCNYGKRVRKEIMYSTLPFENAETFVPTDI